MIRVLAQEYKIDGETNVGQPEGMYGSRLEASFILLLVRRQLLKILLAVLLNQV